MVPGILGKKIGMTQIFEEDGKRIPVTVVEAGPCQVQAIRGKDKDGYNAVQLGYDDTKENRVKKPQREYLKSKNLKFKKFVREFRVTDEPDVKIGDQVTNKMFQKGDFIDVIGISKGKGFQGVVKRHGFAGGNASHGGHSMLRRPGSIGQSSYPSRVYKGMKMPGHMGQDRVTVQNIEVVDVDAENNTLILKGALPGASGTYLIIRFALKKPIAPRLEPEVEEVVEEVQEVEKPEAEKQEAKNQEAPKQEKAEEAPAAEGEDNTKENKEEGKE